MISVDQWFNLNKMTTSLSPSLSDYKVRIIIPTSSISQGENLVKAFSETIVIVSGVGNFPKPLSQPSFSHIFLRLLRY